jgi:hypothetical protein
MHIRTILSTLVFALALSIVSTTTTFAASSDVTNKINQGLQQAGIAVNEQNRQVFATGVENGEYANFNQLVSAMKSWKARTMMANMANLSFNQQTWTFTGTITEINLSRIELTGMNANGIEVWPKFRITNRTQIKNGVLLTNASEEVRREVKNELRRGSVVTVWTTSSGEALAIQNRAPQGQWDFYGPVDCTTCGR